MISVQLNRISGFILMACLIATVFIFVPCKAQENPYQLIKSYDYQNRTGFEEVKAMFREASANKDTAKYLHIEGMLDNLLLNPETTFGGKQEICRILWMYGTNKSVPVLSKLLLDPKLSDSARYALERNGSPAAGRAFRYALGVTNGETRIGIINSIGDRRDPLAVNSLRKYAQSPNPLVSEAAIAALGKIGTTSALSFLLSRPVKAIPIYQAIVSCAYSLAQHDEKGQAEFLFDRIASPPWPLGARAEGLKGLKALHSSKTLDACLACMKVPDADLQLIAASIAGSLPGPAATNRCIAIWHGAPPYVQAALLTAMADRKANAAGNIAIEALQSSDPVLLQTAIRATGLLAGVAGVVPLANLVAQNNAEAQRCLADMKGATVDGEIIYLANHSSDTMRVAMMPVLAKRANLTARMTLMNSAQGNDPLVAVAALNALQQIGTQSDHPSLVALVASTPNNDVREASKNAVLAIGQRMNNRDETIQPVLAALPNAQSPGKAALLEILAEIGGQRALNQLVAATQSPDTIIKSAAVSALSETWDNTDALPALFSIAKSNSNADYQTEALRGYLRLIGQDNVMFPEKKVGEISAAMEIAKRPNELILALSILQDCRVPSAVDIAAKMLDNPDLFLVAANTILNLAAPQRRNNRNYQAVKGDVVNAALDKIIQLTKDPSQKALAQKLKT